MVRIESMMKRWKTIICLSIVFYNFENFGIGLHPLQKLILARQNSVGIFQQSAQPLIFYLLYQRWLG
jgi:hypothetical protein